MAGSMVRRKGRTIHHFFSNKSWASFEHSVKVLWVLLACASGVLCMLPDRTARTDCCLGENWPERANGTDGFAWG